MPQKNSKCGSLCGLKSSLKNLDQKQKEREAYDSAIKDQLENNIIKEVTDTEINNSSNEFCTTHRVVIRYSTESTKLCVFYNASVNSEPRFLLNDCLEKAPPLQDK